MAQRVDHLGAGEQVMRDARRAAGRDIAGAELIARIIGLGAAEGFGAERAVIVLMLRRNNGRHPVFVGDAGPAAGGGEGLGRRAVVLEIVIARVFQRIRPGDEAFVQHPVFLAGRHAVARHQRIGIKRRRAAGLVQHAVADREHVLVVDLDAPREDQAMAIVPAQHHRMARRQHRAARQRPHRVVVRQRLAYALRIGPAEIGEIGEVRALRRQQHDFRAPGVGGVVIFFQAQIVEPRALQQQRSVEVRGVDLDARAARRQRLGARDMRRQASLRDRNAGRRHGGMLRRPLGHRAARLGRLLRRAADEELPGKEDHDRQHGRDDEIAVVAAVHRQDLSGRPNLLGGTGSKPDEPPSQEKGWQRESRRSARPMPFSAPCVSIASIA